MRGVDVFEALCRLAEATGDAVFLENLEGTVLGLNASAEELLGRSRAEVVGRNIFEFLPPENRDLLPDVLGQIEERGVFRVEAWQRRGDGKKYLADVQGVGVSGPDGPCVVIACRDITGARMDRTAALERSSEMETFLHMVAHDLRTPLVSLKGYAGLLHRELAEVGGRPYGFAERLLHQCRRIETLLDDLLEYARLGRDALPSARLQTGAIAAAVWRDLSDRVEEADAVLDLDPDLPPVWMAPLHLRQLLTNLFTNAIKYRREDVKPVVRLTALDGFAPDLTPESHEILMVEDNGIGVPEGEEERILHPFCQGSCAREGTGIGLAIVRRIVENVGGRIWVTPGPNGGSRFFVTLPGGERNRDDTGGPRA